MRYVFIDQYNRFSILHANAERFSALPRGPLLPKTTQIFRHLARNEEIIQTDNVLSKYDEKYIC